MSYCREQIYDARRSRCHGGTRHYFPPLPQPLMERKLQCHCGCLKGNGCLIIIVFNVRRKDFNLQRAISMLARYLFRATGTNSPDSVQWSQLWCEQTWISILYSTQLKFDNNFLFNFWNWFKIIRGGEEKGIALKGPFLLSHEGMSLNLVIMKRYWPKCQYRKGV